MACINWGTRSPGHLIFLIDQSSSMNLCNTEGRSRAEVVAMAIQSAIIDCVNGCISGTQIKNRLFITIIGYGGSDAPNAKIIKEDWVGNYVAELQDVKNNGGLFVPIEANGSAPLSKAFDLATECLETWINVCQEKKEEGIYSDIPAPIVINITDSEPFDGEPDAEARAEMSAQKLKSLRVSSNNVTLFNVYISDEGDEVLFPKCNEIPMDCHVSKFYFGISSNIYNNVPNIHVGSYGGQIHKNVKCLALNIRTESIVTFITSLCSTNICFGSSCKPVRTSSVESGQNNTKLDLEKVANDVRTLSGQFQGSMSELVFNPTSGEFETRQIGSNSSMSVTEMTTEGFAGPPHSSQSKRCSHEPTIWNCDNNHLDTVKPSLWSRLFSKKNRLQSVYTSVFALAEVARKQHVIVQVYLHLQEETEKVKERATEADKNAERRGYEPLEVKLKKGDNVEIELNINGNTLLYNSRKSLTWQGSFVKRSFDYLIPSDLDVYELSCSVNIFVNGAIAGELIFITSIVDSPRALNTNIIAKPTKKLFISYSHKDIKSAERIAKIHEALGIDVFFDKHRLKAGYIYSEEISKFIQTADTFVLCWSENAAESDYVEKERKEALSLAYPQTKPREQASLRIHPYNIEPHATPPADMIEHYHFEEL